MHGGFGSAATALLTNVLKGKVQSRANEATGILRRLQLEVSFLGDMVCDGARARAGCSRTHARAHVLTQTPILDALRRSFPAAPATSQMWFLFALLVRDASAQPLNLKMLVRCEGGGGLAGGGGGRGSHVSWYQQRLQKKAPHDAALLAYIGHHYMQLGALAPAAVHYERARGVCGGHARACCCAEAHTRVRALALRPHDPLINLCIGVAHVCNALSVSGPERHETVFRGLAFISHYKTLRTAEAAPGDDAPGGAEDGDGGESNGGGGGGGAAAAAETTAVLFRRTPVPPAVRIAEAEYNLGRAFHQLGLVHLAIPCYERALSTLDGAVGISGAMDVRLEAAFNLAQLYRCSGGAALAREISRKYLVIE